MSFGLGRGRRLDVSGVGIEAADLPVMPDADGEPVAARLDPREWFDDPARPFEVEIGSGKGTFLLHRAEANPATNFLGIEWAKEFWAYAADRFRRRGLRNVRLLRADAVEFLRWRMPDGIVRVIHLYFSDPWPKKRHHKRRVVQDRFLEEARRVLAPCGEVRIVTDHEEYWQWMEQHFARWAPTATTGDPGPFERRPFEASASAGLGEVVGTNYERKFAREGRMFHAATLRLRGSPDHR